MHTAPARCLCRPKPRRSRCSQLYRIWRDTERTLKKHREKVENAAREADYIAFFGRGTEKLSPQDGEEDDLAERRQKMMKAERIAGDIAEASEFLNGNASPVPLIASLVRRLERKSHEAPGLLEDTVALLDAALDQLSNAQMEVEAALRKTEYDPKELERVEERLFALRAASRKYSVPVTELPALAVRMISDLADLDAGEEKLQSLRPRSAQPRQVTRRRLVPSIGEAASCGDGAGGRRHGRTAGAEAGARPFHGGDHHQSGRGAAEGIDVVEFHVQTNPGTRPGSIMKVASGGELSRFLLALKVALADRGSAPTLVFDEIDTGVGGAVADAIGQRLKRLSDRVQVLSVTHAPQVAARAATHLLISKGPASEGSEKIATRVATMEPKDRHRRDRPHAGRRFRHRRGEGGRQAVAACRCCRSPTPSPTRMSPSSSARAQLPRPQGDGRDRLTAEPKIDGLSLSLRYERARSSMPRRAATARRARTSRSMPARSPKSRMCCRASDVPEIAEVRGEVYLGHADFAGINERQREKGLPNSPIRAMRRPARCASSTSRSPRRGRCASSPMPGARCRCMPADTQFGVVEAFKRWGFRTNPLMKRCESVEELLERYRLIEASAPRSATISTASSTRSTISRCSAARLRRARAALGDRA
jgi:hypothetical protein